MRVAEVETQRDVGIVKMERLDRVTRRQAEARGIVVQAQAESQRRTGRIRDLGADQRDSVPTARQPAFEGAAHRHMSHDRKTVRHTALDRGRQWYRLALLAFDVESGG